MRRRGETQIPSYVGRFWPLDTACTAGLDSNEIESDPSRAALRLRPRFHHRPGPSRATGRIEGRRL
jgi:hypothetical protein